MSAAEPRFYFDQESAGDDETPYGEDTARIIDTVAGGVIVYTHVLTAPALVNLLNTNPMSLDGALDGPVGSPAPLAADRPV